MPNTFSEEEFVFRVMVSFWSLSLGFLFVNEHFHSCRLSALTCRERFLSAPPLFRQARKVCSFFNCDSSYAAKPTCSRCEYKAKMLIFMLDLKGQLLMKAAASSCRRVGGLTSSHWNTHVHQHNVLWSFVRERSHSSGSCMEPYNSRRKQQELFCVMLYLLILHFEPLWLPV